MITQPRNKVNHVLAKGPLICAINFLFIFYLTNFDYVLS